MKRQFTTFSFALWALCSEPLWGGEQEEWDGFFDPAIYEPFAGLDPSVFDDGLPHKDTLVAGVDYVFETDAPAPVVAPAPTPAVDPADRPIQRTRVQSTQKTSAKTINVSSRESYRFISLPFDTQRDVKKYICDYFDRLNSKSVNISKFTNEMNAFYEKPSEENGGIRCWMSKSAVRAWYNNWKAGRIKKRRVL